MIHHMDITHNEQEAIYRTHNAKMLDGLQVGDFLVKNSGIRGEHLIKVTGINIISEENVDFEVFFLYVDNERFVVSPESVMRNMLHVKCNMSKQTRDLAVI